jgi:GntR family transcriptional regulator
VAVTEQIFATAMELQRHPGTTAHSQIERWFMDAIARGDLAPGDRLPREQDLAESFGVSRMTLRQALAGLGKRGVIKRVPGRSGGTFIVEPKIECDLTGLAGFTEQLRRSNLRAHARIIRAETVAAPRAVATALGLPRGALVHEVVRVRSAEGTPLALERSFFPGAVFPDFLDHRLTGSLYRLMARTYQQEPRTAVESLEPISTSADEAALLGIEAGLAVMLIERTAFTAAGLAVEFARDLFRSDRIKISIRSGWTGGRADDLAAPAPGPRRHSI